MKPDNSERNAYQRRIEIFKIAQREIDNGKSYTLTTRVGDQINPYDHSIMENMPAFINGIKIQYRAVGSSSEWTFSKDISEWKVKGATVNVRSVKGNIGLAITQINELERMLPMVDLTATDAEFRGKLSKLKSNLTNTLKEI